MCLYGYTYLGVEMERWVKGGVGEMLYLYVHKYVFVCVLWVMHVWVNIWIVFSSVPLVVLFEVAVVWVEAHCPGRLEGCMEILCRDARVTFSSS